MKPTYEELEQKCALQQLKLAAINELMSVVEKASDVAKACIEELQSQNADMAVQLANTESKCRELAAENAALKDAIGKHADSYIMCGYCRTERDGKNDDVCEVLDSTPATDDFLAEVRAQGVDELAELYLTLAHHEANRSIAENWRESARFAKDYAAQLRKGGAA